MAVEQRKQGRVQATRNLKRGLILEAARRVFEAEGLEGASLRAIAAAAGYTPAALYFHFESKEAIYAEILQVSLAKLGEVVRKEASQAIEPTERLRAAAMAFFRFYAENPRDLDLGFYLFRGGMTPEGLGKDRNEHLNRCLEAALNPIAEAAVQAGASPGHARILMVDVFAHTAGLLLLSHTGRMRVFQLSARDRMEAYLETCLDNLPRPKDQVR
ncbi:TetR/AcrR family transcriptional regulator [Microvirga subterranea]|uniref:TetR family transcriptional regulator n=1 Tax=Microvirga subterranea TaxID=186651 RepID=A0A370HSI2_9HYPH|nr:TetR/AcrR family transcriptional regulator [Microvirga subterranea]RDI61275.1 TetR family transcriptional regulator [Microvirga subterranea]